MKTKKKTNKKVLSSCTENSDQVKVVDLSNSVNEYLGLTPESKETPLKAIFGELLSDMALSENSTISSWSKFVGNSFNGMVGESIFSETAMAPKEMLDFFNWAKEHYGLEHEYPVDKMEEIIVEYREWKSERMLRPIVEVEK